MNQNKKRRKKVIDTLKTSCAGVGGLALTFMEWLPDMVRLGIGIVTFAYMVLKFKKEIM
jgi:hypothetical protein